MRWLPACGVDVSAASHSGLSSVILPPSSEVVGHTNSERPTLWSLLLLRRRCVVRVDLLASATDSLFFFFFVYVACVNGRTYAVLFSFSVAATSRTTTTTTTITTRASCIRVSYSFSFKIRLPRCRVPLSSILCASLIFPEFSLGRVWSCLVIASAKQIINQKKNLTDLVTFFPKFARPLSSCDFGLAAGVYRPF